MVSEIKGMGSTMLAFHLYGWSYGMLNGMHVTASLVLLHLFLALPVLLWCAQRKCDMQRTFLPSEICLCLGMDCCHGVQECMRSHWPVCNTDSLLHVP